MPAAGGSRSRSKAKAACSRSAARRSTSPATCGRMSKAATIPRPSWPIRRPCCRASTVGEALDCLELTAKEHTTQPPARFSEAALTKALEERGIGRPSTYASIIDTILARNYVFKKGSALVPTWVAFSVVQAAGGASAGLVDYQFTAQMEDDLDAISRGEQEHVEYLQAFYFGNGTPGLKQQLEHKSRRDRRPRHQPHLHRHARRRRAGVRPRRPLFAVRRARRAHGVAAGRNAAGRSDARRRR